jgi:electron transfer flavoprotein alpha subunit
MSGALVVAEFTRGQVDPVTAELVTAGVQLGLPVDLAIVAETPADHVDECCFEGLRAILLVPTSLDVAGTVNKWALVSLIADRSPDVVLMAFTIGTMNYAPALAVQRALPFASDVLSITSDANGLRACRPFYAGKLVGEVAFPGRRPPLLLLRSGVWKPAEASIRPPTSVLDAESPQESRIRQLARLAPQASDVDISEAPVLVAIGRGIREQENVALFENVATGLGALLCGSRPLVDSGWLDPSRQVGQSGKSVQPRVYLAFGVSGATQHLAGLRDAGTIIAVNTDRHAPIFSVAQFGAIADAVEVAEELRKLA